MHGRRIDVDGPALFRQGVAAAQAKTTGQCFRRIKIGAYGAVVAADSIKSLVVQVTVRHFDLRFDKKARRQFEAMACFCRNRKCRVVVISLGTRNFRLIFNAGNLADQIDKRARFRKP